MSVSIIIPVFNRAHLVRRAIDSALEQTTPCEVLLVDHGSKDDILAVSESYGSRIRYIRRERDNGPIACWIDGVEQATGEFIHFTYDDDWIQPTFIESCVSQFDDSVAFVYTRATLHDTNSGSSRTLLRHPAGARPIQDIVQYLLSSPLTISPGCALFRRKDALKNLVSEIPGAQGIYGKNSGVGEDLLLFLLTALDYDKYVHIPAALADFLAHSQSITIKAKLTAHQGDLVESYKVAKNFYGRQTNALKPMTGIKSACFDLLWTLNGYFTTAF